MRLLSCLIAFFCIGLVSAASALAQEQYEPYHKHYDKHHGHNHAYPDRGAIFREVPRGAIFVNYAGVSYRFSDGIWFEPRGPAFIVVAPPIGLLVSSLPAIATRIDRGSESYLYANDIYYRARPDLGGYEVVNDPEDGAVPAGAVTAAAAAPAPATPAAAPVAATAAAATAASAPANPAAADSTAPNVPLTATLTTATAGNAIPSTAAQVTPPVAIPVSAAQAAQPSVSVPVPAPTLATAVPSAAVPTPAVLTAAVPTSAPVVAAAGAPASSVPAPASGPSRGVKVMAYPKNGQTPDVQARDHYECYRFAVAQTGFDPMHANGPAAAGNTEQADYDRAQAACFEGRGYTVR